MVEAFCDAAIAYAIPAQDNWKYLWSTMRVFSVLKVQLTAAWETFGRSKSVCGFRRRGPDEHHHVHRSASRKRQSEALVRIADTCGSASTYGVELNCHPSAAYFGEYIPIMGISKAFSAAAVTRI